MTEENKELVKEEVLSVDEIFAQGLKEEEPTLELTDIVQAKEINTQPVVLTTYKGLSEQEQKTAEQMAKAIDHTNATQVLQLGSVQQSNIGNFSKSLLSHVKLDDFEEVGEDMGSLMTLLSKNSAENLSKEPNLLKRFFGFGKAKFDEAMVKQKSVENVIEVVNQNLDKAKSEILKENQMYENLYNLNLKYYKELNVFIAAAELKLKDLNENVVPKALAKANETEDGMDAQSVKDLQEQVSRLEKQVYNLKLVRHQSIQKAPQIRLIQNNNVSLAEKIQLLTNHVVPAWRDHFIIQISLDNQMKVAKLGEGVIDMNNKLIKETADMLEISSVETVRLSERGIVDVETLEYSQEKLISTIQEVSSIQEEGKQKRKETEEKLEIMENDLKAKLLAMSNEGIGGINSKNERKNVN